VQALHTTVLLVDCLADVLFVVQAWCLWVIAVPWQKRSSHKCRWICIC